MTWNNTHYLIFLELRSVKWVGKVVFLLQIQERICFLTFSSFEMTPRFLGLWSFLCTILTSDVIVICPVLTLTSRLSLVKILLLHWAHVANVGLSPHLKILHWGFPAKTSLWYMMKYSQVLGSKSWTSLGVYDFIYHKWQMLTFTSAQISQP